MSYDDELFDLYDEYCHSAMQRRDFLRRAALSAGGVLLAQTMLPDYARAQTVSFTDKRIKARYVTYPSPGGNSGTMRGYLVQPRKKGPFPAVLVVHENRGLNPYIEDVARRVATRGFLAFAPDGLYPLGGYPGNDDDGKVMQRKLDRAKLSVDMKNGAEFLRTHALSNGKLGVTGFCFGGGVANYLAVELGAHLKVAAPFYGRAPSPDDVAKIKAALVIHYAARDPRVNAMKAAYRAALRKHHVNFKMYSYRGTSHGFHNNSTPRYQARAARLAWKRTIAAFRRYLR